MTLEELMDMRVGDVLVDDESAQGVQVLRDKRDGKERVLIFASGADAEYILQLLTLTEKEPDSCDKN